MKADFFDQIYDYMLGLTLPELTAPQIVKHVKNEFQCNAYCDRLYSDILDARMRLGYRLETDEEDSDIMTIVDGYEHMARYLAEKMYEYGLHGLKEQSDS